MPGNETTAQGPTSRSFDFTPWRMQDHFVYVFEIRAGFRKARVNTILFKIRANTRMRNNTDLFILRQFLTVTENSDLVGHFRVVRE